MILGLLRELINKYKVYLDFSLEYSFIELTL
jgi:hypothetical protein